MSISLLATIFNFISFLVTVYYFGMIIYFFTSWVPNIRESVVGRFLSSIYEPYLEPFRKIIPPLGMIDISSLVALFVLILFQWGLDSIFRAILIYVAAYLFRLNEGSTIYLPSFYYVIELYWYV